MAVPKHASLDVSRYAGRPSRDGCPHWSNESGLPAGIQIVAPMWEDGTSIEFASLLADAVGGFIEPDLFRE